LHVDVCHQKKLVVFSLSLFLGEVD